MGIPSKVKVGDKFGRLTVMEHIGSEGGSRVWKCKCECGNICDVKSHFLRSGKKGSCGCLRREKWGTQEKREKHPKWKGGKIRDKMGYVLLLTPPGHPPGSVGNGRYTFEHRLVMENHLGRYLLPTESIHHKNGIKSDNRLKNLELRISKHGPGQSVDDLVKYAISILQKYRPDILC
jgi:hypothetical protein